MKSKRRIKLIAEGQILRALTVVVVIALGISVVVISNKLQAQINNPQTTDKPPTLSGRTGTKTNGTEPAIFLTEIPEGYRNWKLISVSRIASPKGAQLRAELGNDIAVKAYREGEIPFPDGAIIVALHWKEVSTDENNKVLAQGFPGAGLQSFTPGPGVNMQFIVKNSKKYAATGGWGFGDFANGKPGSEALMNTCFACHMPAKDHDFVYTRYAPF